MVMEMLKESRPVVAAIPLMPGSQEMAHGGSS